MKLPIYLDNHSTTQIDPRVLQEMLPFFIEKFGNASSRSHSFGWEAESEVEKARKKVATLIGASSPKELIFTSGATESINIALKGVAEMYQGTGKHIVTVLTEHKATLDCAKYLEKNGFDITYLQVDKFGRINIEDLLASLTEKTILISVMHANNEVGTIQPIEEIGKIAKEKEILFHVDAAQTVGKIPIQVDLLGVDLLSFSSHKMYGPKGIGALFVRRFSPRVRLSPILHGGGHERGLRSGTLNVPAIVGFGSACEIAQQEMQKTNQKILKLRNQLEKKLFGELNEIYLNGHPTERLVGNLNISFCYIEGEALMMGLKEIAVSSGSACTSASLEPSYVLKAMGVGDELAHSSIRFGIGKFNTEEEMEFVANKVIEAVIRLREMSPLYEMAQEGIDLKTMNWTTH